MEAFACFLFLLQKTGNDQFVALEKTQHMWLEVTVDFYREFHTLKNVQNLLSIYACQIHSSTLLPHTFYVEITTKCPTLNCCCLVLACLMFCINLLELFRRFLDSFIDQTILQTVSATRHFLEFIPLLSEFYWN